MTAIDFNPSADIPLSSVANYYYFQMFSSFYFCLVSSLKRPLDLSVDFLSLRGYFRSRRPMFLHNSGSKKCVMGIFLNHLIFEKMKTKKS